jgi:hypothetical protein
MEAKELRIGNIFGFGEMIHKATHWDIRNLRVQELKGKNSLTYKPVPLTQEWLLKFGFQINRQTKEENNIWRCYFEEGFFEIEQIGDCFYLNDNHCHGT